MFVSVFLYMENHMNLRLIIAAGLAAVTFGVHFFAGGADVAAPLLASALAPEPKFTLYAVWHMASAALALSSAGLFIGAIPRHVRASRYLVLFISILWCTFGIVFLVIAAAQPERGWFLKMPQWILLLPVGLLGFWGGKQGQPGSPERIA
jgi:hypothetical protein